MIHLKITLHIQLRTAFHTTGNCWQWGADKALVRRSDGAYVLPATSFKGALRAQAEQILGDKACNAPNPKHMCSNPEHLCLACEVFGNPRKASPLRFFDVVFPDPKTQIRASVAISRRRSAAVPQQLYFVETTGAGFMEAQADIQGLFPFEKKAKEAAALVVLAVRMLPALGTGRTRGLGWLEAIKAKCTIDDQPLAETVLKGYWDQWLGGGQ